MMVRLEHLLENAKTKIVWIEPTDRFDTVKFGNEIFDGRALPMGTAYSCGGCGSKLGFDKNDFERRASRKITNLSPDVAAQFDACAIGRGYGQDSFLDWNCPECGLAIRAYVRSWAGGRHGESGVYIIAVAEES